MDFPGSPEVEALSFYVGSVGLIPDQGTDIPHAAWCGNLPLKKTPKQAKSTQVTWC